MKVWTVLMEMVGHPEEKLYIVGMHSNREAAETHQQQVTEPGVNVVHVLDFDLDVKQPPVLIGRALPDVLSECKKNLPND
ncbi:MAG: hypothetical protein ACE5EH_00275 [Gammaproteobacteria bacterium]